MIRALSFELSDTLTDKNKHKDYTPEFKALNSDQYFWTAAAVLVITGATDNLIIDVVERTLEVIRERRGF